MIRTVMWAVRNRYGMFLALTKYSIFRTGWQVGFWCGVVVYGLASLFWQTLYGLM